MNTFGKNIRISLFGESHGNCIGITIDGLPSGITLDEDLIKTNLKKRHGLKQISTKRNEQDKYKIISGYFQNKTTGAPLTFIIENNDIDSSSYAEGVIRPNHSDYPYYVKYNGNNDYRGGGHSSGRLTPLLVIAGSICEQILMKENIFVYSHLSQVGNIKSAEINDADKLYLINNFNEDQFMIEHEKESEVLNYVQKLMDNNDSASSKLETLIKGLPVGLGEPFFDSFESILAHLLFSIPGLKSVSFGDDDLIYKTGLEQTDEIKYKNDDVEVLTNHQGGINGGISNGSIVKFSTTFKAPASTAAPKNSINILNKENIKVQTYGRHDPIIGIKALQVVTSATYIVCLDMLMELKKYEYFR